MFGDLFIIIKKSIQTYNENVDEKKSKNRFTNFVMILLSFITYRMTFLLNENARHKLTALKWNGNIITNMANLNV